MAWVLHRSVFADRIPNRPARQRPPLALFPARSKVQVRQRRISAESAPSQNRRKSYPRDGTARRHWECSIAAQPSQLRVSESTPARYESEFSFLPTHLNRDGFAKEKPSKAGT